MLKERDIIVYMEESQARWAENKLFIVNQIQHNKYDYAIIRCLDTMEQHVISADYPYVRLTSKEEYNERLEAINSKCEIQKIEL